MHEGSDFSVKIVVFQIVFTFNLQGQVVEIHFLDIVEPSIFCKPKRRYLLLFFDLTRDIITRRYLKYFIDHTVEVN